MKHATLPSGVERAELEKLGDQMEVIARQVIARDTFGGYDAGGHEIIVRDVLYRYAWDIKQMARFGTASYGV